MASQKFFVRRRAASPTRRRPAPRPMANRFALLRAGVGLRDDARALGPTRLYGFVRDRVKSQRHSVNCVQVPYVGW